MGDDQQALITEEMPLFIFHSDNLRWTRFSQVYLESSAWPTPSAVTWRHHCRGRMAGEVRYRSKNILGSKPGFFGCCLKLYVALALFRKYSEVQFAKSLLTITQEGCRLAQLASSARLSGVPS